MCRKRSQAFNREKEVEDLFPGKNYELDVGPPRIVFAPVGSGKTTILQMGAAKQPHTLMCTVRSAENQSFEDNHDPEKFVKEFTISLGLEPRDSHLLKFIFKLIDRQSGIVFCA